ncbi:MAG: isoprenyl transferase [Bacteroidales bacterium]
MTWKEKINPEHLPGHIAIIMDGNGRWAKKRGQHRIFGHENGVQSVRNVAEACAEIGVKYLTLYAFSTENWNRPQPEVSALMGLLVQTLNSELKTLQDNKIRLRAIGNIKSLDPECQKELASTIKQTENNDRLTMILALSYSSHWEITDAVKKISLKVKNNELDINTIDQSTVASHLVSAEFPDPELLIRTSGEYRISNFLLWQIAYTELYFTPKLWPDFGKEDLYEAIVDFQNRERRFGLTSEQINLV